MKFFISLFLFVTVAAAAFAQQSVIYMQYNLLNYGNFTSYCTSSNNNQDAKDGYLKTILDYIRPDILAVNEVGRSSSNAIRLLDEVLNENTYGVTYKRADITNNANSDLINLFFYNPEKVQLESQEVAQSVLRDINRYRLYAIDENLNRGDTTFLNCFVAHLKAGSDNDDEELRGTMTQNLMYFLEWKDIQEPVVFSGDMNFYSDDEEGVMNLMNHPDEMLRFYDPLDKMGNWHNSSYYEAVHTQSTHADYSGCAASGGMDDRFDFVFINKSIRDGLQGVSYIANSYRAVGNDGEHFNKGLLDYPVNNTVPEEVLNALYYNSDHLPVVMEMEMKTEAGIADIQLLYPQVKVVNPVVQNIEISCFSKELESFTYTLIDMTGRVAAEESGYINPGAMTLVMNPPKTKGLHLLLLRFGNGKRICKKIIL